ncbi:TetR/AcrR family transcriptional regulator [Zhihengliuella sp.]|uniref:TetR/AcrR family transcriptional regulator n=1 Tax=Zhihengliuella sp. TaxID=1954483 RepID=UPI0028127519|nr:TetR/AcrR family transcriptional regulator [Zhihengliuella sp.]
MNSTSDTPPDPGGTRDGRSQRWDAHREARRTELLRLARKAVHRFGPSASMEEIAAFANTSKSVFYRYFGDKSGLRRDLGAVVVQQMRAAVVGAAKAAPTEEEGLRRMVGAYLELAESSPNVYFFVTAVDHDPLAGAQDGAEEPLDTFFRDVTALVAESLTHYLLRDPGTSGEEASRRAQFWPQAAIGMVRAAGEAWLRETESPTRPSHGEMTEILTGWLVHGIGRPHTKGQ